MRAGPRAAPRVAPRRLAHEELASRPVGRTHPRAHAAAAALLPTRGGTMGFVSFFVTLRFGTGARGRPRWLASWRHPRGHPGSSVRDGSIPEQLDRRRGFRDVVDRNRRDHGQRPDVRILPGEDDAGPSAGLMSVGRDVLVHRFESGSADGCPCIPVRHPGHQGVQPPIVFRLPVQRRLLEQFGDRRLGDLRDPPTPFGASGVAADLTCARFLQR